MKKLLIVLFVMVCCAGAAYAAVPSPSTPMIQLPDGSIVSSSNPLPTTSVGGSAAYKDEAGAAASGELDSDSRVKVNVGSETIGLVDAIDAITAAVNSTKGSVITEIQHNTQELTANTVATVTSSLTADTRKFVEITAMSSTQEFWIQVDGAKSPVIEECRLCVGGVYLELPKASEIGIIASETITINVVEGGY